MINTTPPDATDIRTDGWVDTWLPGPARPYAHLARLDRPIGTWLVLLPCWWSLALAAEGWPNWTFVILCAVGAVVMRGAGCTLNDIADRNFDGQVARTATRPIPSGAITVPQAFVFMVVLGLIGLAVLVNFPPYAIAVGAASLVTVAIYPFMKRFTYWPQIFLGLAFNWGALLGWAAVREDIAWPAVALYVGGIFWTLGYDTIYAHQDKEDDVQVGVKSTALRLGDATPVWLVGFYTLTIALFAVAGYLTQIGWPFFVGLAFAAAHLAWQVKTVDIHDPKNCLARFKSNRDFGLIVFIAIVAGRLIP